MLLHESWPIPRVPPRIRYIEMRGNGQQSVVRSSVRAAVVRLHAGRVDAFDGKLVKLQFVVVALAADADDGVQGDLHVGQLFSFLVHEETDDAAQYSLMGHYQDVVRPLQLRDDRLHALHRVDVALAPRITIAQFILIAPREFLTTEEICRTIFECSTVKKLGSTERLINL